MTALVFAFGSNMSSERFRGYGMQPVGPGRAALLTGYSLEFTKLSKDDSGKASVHPCSQDHVWGVLYQIPDVDLCVLDRREGSGYRREALTVSVDDSLVEAWVYVAKDPVRTGLLRPYSWYKQFLIFGAREHSLPSEYINRILEVEDVVDEDSDRDKKNELLLKAEYDR
jgi:gamma-glutamylcyclotransferase